MSTPSNRKFTDVTAEQFHAFIKSYPNKLETDYNRIGEFLEYNDFSLGNWPESQVAGHRKDDRQTPEDSYFINSKLMSTQEQNTTQPIGVWKCKPIKQHRAFVLGYSFTLSNWNRFSIRYGHAPKHQCICQKLFGWHLIIKKVAP